MALLSNCFESIALLTISFASTLAIMNAASYFEPSKHKQKRVSKLEDILSLADLAELAFSQKILRQESAINIILDRAISPDFLPHIIEAAKDGRNQDMQTKALSCIKLLSAKSLVLY